MPGRSAFTRVFNALCAGMSGKKNSPGRGDYFFFFFPARRYLRRRLVHRGSNFAGKSSRASPSIKLNQSLYNQQLEHHLEHHKEALELRSFKLCLRLCLEKNAMSKFDYRAPAELFPSRNRKSRQLVKYRRFDTAADAIQFAMEKLPAPALLGAFIEIDEARLGHAVIRELYESPDYPLKKQAMNETIARAPTSDA
jgi:hypothetical protein